MTSGRFVRILLWSSLVATPAAAELTFEGLDEELERNATALVRLASTPCDRPRWRVERLFRNADAELQGALEALG